jgi:hypothetical protein
VESTRCGMAICQEHGTDMWRGNAQVDLKDKWRNLERQGVVQASDGVLAAGAGMLTPEQQQQAQQQQPMVDTAALMAQDGGAMMQVQDPAAVAAAAAAAHAHAQAVGQPEQMMHHVEGGMPPHM